MITVTWPGRAWLAGHRTEEVHAGKFWQDARPGDKFRLPASPWPRVVFDYVTWHRSTIHEGRMYVHVTGSITAFGETYEYHLTSEIDDRVVWFRPLR